MSEKLTTRQARFVEEYLVDGNATQAAIRAGYSAATAAQIGEQNLRKLEVAQVIAERQSARSQRVQLAADEVLLQLASLTRSSVRHFVLTDGGDVQLAEGAPEDAWQSVASIKRKTRIIPQKDGEAVVEHDVELKLWDKNTALANAMKHLGLLRDASTLTLNNITAVRVEIVRE